MRDDNHQNAGDEEEQQLQDWDEYLDLQEDTVFGEEINNVVSDRQIPDADDTFTPDIFEDTYLNKEIAIARGPGDDNDGVQFGRVTKRLRNADGKPISKAHAYPLLETREYEVEFIDGHS